MVVKDSSKMIKGEIITTDNLWLTVQITLSIKIKEIIIDNAYSNR